MVSRMKKSRSYPAKPAKPAPTKETTKNQGVQRVLDYVKTHIQKSIFGKLPEFKPLVHSDIESKKQFASLLEDVEQQIGFNVEEFLVPKVAHESTKEVKESLKTSEIEQLALLKTIVDFLNHLESFGALPATKKGGNRRV